MAQVVSFKDLEMAPSRQGVRRGSITAGTTDWMDVELIRLAPGAEAAETVPEGSDCYLFTIRGGAVIIAGGAAQAMPVKTAAVIQQQTSYNLSNPSDGETEVLKVLAPPQGANTGLTGFNDGVMVRPQDSLAFVDIPADKKRRQYIVGKGAAQSERGHAMIVHYERDTFTALHHHPNAESMFVLLDGSIKFTIDGEEVTVGPGQATVFGAGDRHGLRCGEGITKASFLEFHIPGAFTTVREL